MILLEYVVENISYCVLPQVLSPHSDNLEGSVFVSQIFHSGILLIGFPRTLSKKWQQNDR